VPHLLYLTGRGYEDEGQAWAALRERHAAYYREREEAERLASVAVVICSYCRKGAHSYCSGRALYGTVPCVCERCGAALNATGGA
jgi:hypothetical protein